MDIARTSRRRTARPRFIVPIAAVAVFTAGAWFAWPAFERVRGTETVVDRAALVIDTAARGTLVRTVRAAGTFVPNRIDVIAASASGVALDIDVRAGSHVTAGDTVARFANPDLDAAVADAAAQRVAAIAELSDARAQAAAMRLDQQAAYRSADADARRAGQEAAAVRPLHAQGLVSDLSFREAQIKADEERDLVSIAGRKVGVSNIDGMAKVAVAQAAVERISATLAARQAQRATLVIRAERDGIVQSVAVTPGQRVDAGAEVARLVGSHDLKAVLAVPQADVRGVTPGLPVSLALEGGGSLQGRVTRLGPVAQNGALPVDVALARVSNGIAPDETVDGTIVLARYPQALSIARPVAASDDATVTLYRLTSDGRNAVRTQVRLGTGSLERVRVLAGLVAGDRVIVSDTSSYVAPSLHLQ